MAEQLVCGMSSEDCTNCPFGPGNCPHEIIFAIEEQEKKVSRTLSSDIGEGNVSDNIATRRFDHMPFGNYSTPVHLSQDNLS